MKRIILAAALCGLFLTTASLSGCKDKKASAADTLTAKVADISNNAEREDVSLTDTFTASGHTFRISVHRYSNTEGKEYKDEFGTGYFDNEIDIRATRDGEELFNKHFSKSAFRSHVEADSTSYILQGIGFYKTKSDATNLVFGVQLGEPGTDDGKYFLLLTITPTGEIDIRKDTEPDTTADDGGAPKTKLNKTEPDDDPDEQV